ncbi:MAG: hypothetical protein MI725_01435, partial [Pirellulales bacterium]|nr:hypothetical protein [Pirellulales bacterium]
TDAQSWVACTAGAEYHEVYVTRLERAGFQDIRIESEISHFLDDDDTGAVIDTASFKVVAHKPR